MLFVQDSALVEDEKDIMPQSPGPNQLHETFTLDAQENDTSESGGRGNPTDTEGRSGEESDLSQNEVEDKMKKVCTDNQHRLSKLHFPVFLFIYCTLLRK